MSKYGIILKVGNKYIHVGMTREAKSTEVHNTQKILKDVVDKDHWDEGLVLAFPGTEPATQYQPGGPGGGGRQVPIRHDLLELREDLREQTDWDTWDHPPLTEEDVDPPTPAEDALDLLEKAANREQTARSLVEDYRELQSDSEESDFETVPEIAEYHGVHVRTLYRVVKERLTEEDRILPKRLVEEQAA